MYREDAPGFSGATEKRHSATIQSAEKLEDTHPKMLRFAIHPMQIEAKKRCNTHRHAQPLHTKSRHWASLLMFEGTWRLRQPLPQLCRGSPCRAKKKELPTCLAWRKTRSLRIQARFASTAAVVPHHGAAQRSGTICTHSPM